MIFLTFLITYNHLIYAELEAAYDERMSGIRETFSWRDEYVRAAAGWHPRHSWQAAEGAVLEHATLDVSGRALAIAADDASVSVSLHQKN